MGSVILSVLFLSTSVQGPLPNFPSEVSLTVGDMSMEVESAEPAQVAVCNASTQCPYGGVAWCSAYGAGCTYYINPGQSVTCTGMVNGYWQTITSRCY